MWWTVYSQEPDGKTMISFINLSSSFSSSFTFSSCSSYFSPHIHTSSSIIEILVILALKLTTQRLKALLSMPKHQKIQPCKYLHAAKPLHGRGHLMVLIFCTLNSMSVLFVPFCGTLSVVANWSGYSSSVCWIPVTSWPWFTRLSWPSLLSSQSHTNFSAVYLVLLN